MISDMMDVIGIEKDRIQEILENFKYHIALLGGPGVGKTSMLNKIMNNYIEHDLNGSVVSSMMT